MHSYNVRNSFPIALCCLDGGTLLHEEPHTIQPIVGGCQMDRKISMIVPQSNITLSLNQTDQDVHG